MVFWFAMLCDVKIMWHISNDALAVFAKLYSKRILKVFKWHTNIMYPSKCDVQTVMTWPLYALCCVCCAVRSAIHFMSIMVHELWRRTWYGAHKPWSLHAHTTNGIVLHKSTGLRRIVWLTSTTLSGWSDVRYSDCNDGEISADDMSSMWQHKYWYSSSRMNGPNIISHIHQCGESKSKKANHLSFHFWYCTNIDQSFFDWFGLLWMCVCFRIHSQALSEQWRMTRFNSSCELLRRWASAEQGNITLKDVWRRRIRNKKYTKLGRHIECHKLHLVLGERCRHPVTTNTLNILKFILDWQPFSVWTNCVCFFFDSFILATSIFESLRTSSE